MKITHKETDYRYKLQTENLYNLYTEFVILRVKLDQFFKLRGNLDQNLKLGEH